LVGLADAKGPGVALHFKLFVRDAPRARKPKPPNAGNDEDDEDDEEDEFVFVPILDPKRDAAVIDLLPQYLRDEITFSREHAAKFYQKINAVLVRPPVTEGTEEESEEEGEEGGSREESEEVEDDGEDADVTMALSS
jgi:hypothetical protein